MSINQKEGVNQQGEVKSMHTTARSFGLPNDYNVYVANDKTVGGEEIGGIRTTLFILWKPTYKTSLLFLDAELYKISEVVLKKVCEAYSIVYSPLTVGQGLNKKLGIDLGVEFNDVEKGRFQKIFKEIWAKHGICRLPQYLLTRMDKINDIIRRGKLYKIDNEDYFKLRHELILEVMNQEKMPDKLSSSYAIVSKDGEKIKAAKIIYKPQIKTAILLFDGCIESSQLEEIVKIALRRRKFKKIAKSILKNQFNDVSLYGLIFEIENEETRKEEIAKVKNLIKNIIKEVIVK